jgi:hypothetical protein
MGQNEHVALLTRAFCVMVFSCYSDFYILSFCGFVSWTASFSKEPQTSIWLVSGVAGNSNQQQK